MSRLCPNTLSSNGRLDAIRLANIWTSAFVCHERPVRTVHSGVTTSESDIGGMVEGSSPETTALTPYLAPFGFSFPRSPSSRGESSILDTIEDTPRERRPAHRTASGVANMSGKTACANAQYPLADESSRISTPRQH